MGTSLGQKNIGFWLRRSQRAVVGWSWEPPLFSSILQIHKRHRASHFCRGVRANGEMARKWPKNDNIQKPIQKW